MSAEIDTDNEVVSLSIDDFRDNDSSPAMPKASLDMKFTVTDIELKKIFNGEEAYMLRVVLDNNSREVDASLTTSSQKGTVEWIDLKNGTPNIVYNIDDSAGSSILFGVTKGADIDSKVGKSIQGTDTIILIANASRIEIIKARLKKIDKVYKRGSHYKVA